LGHHGERVVAAVAGLQSTAIHCKGAGSKTAKIVSKFVENPHETANVAFKALCYGDHGGKTKKSRRERGSAMRFLLKVAFWLTVVVLLLPTPQAEHPLPASQIGAGDAMSAASAMVSDMRQFCSRQPEACAIGSQAITQFGYKAEAAAKMLYEFLNERLGSERAGGADKAASSMGKPSQNTLTPADIAPAWRGPPARKDVELKRPA
jgi:hypothetical protein